MVATYEKTVQNAFAEVSDALATVGTVNRQCAALKDLVNATETAYRLSQSRYKNGLDGFRTGKPKTDGCCSDELHFCRE